MNNLTNEIGPKTIKKRVWDPLVEPTIRTISGNPYITDVLYTVSVISVGILALLSFVNFNFSSYEKFLIDHFSFATNALPILSRIDLLLLITGLASIVLLLTWKFLVSFKNTVQLCWQYIWRYLSKIIKFVIRPLGKKNNTMLRRFATLVTSFFSYKGFNYAVKSERLKVDNETQGEHFSITSLPNKFDSISTNIEISEDNGYFRAGIVLRGEGSSTVNFHIIKDSNQQTKLAGRLVVIDSFGNTQFDITEPPRWEVGNLNKFHLSLKRNNTQLEIILDGTIIMTTPYSLPDKVSAVELHAWGDRNPFVVNFKDILMQSEK